MNERVEICITNVYGPNSESEREVLWVELKNIRSLATVLWCIGGDFNVVRFPPERKEEAPS